ncbi:2'-5' RNA ligase family protein [Clostridium arbusti]|uniref:2'-5' RNA ligase family protein n=1 Tax=Clostridium arbusti TaxID=1137848 RepID=UPI000289CCC7|nr:2'-5' RNA ligase family protein [Clostridium arbusti]
MRYVIVTTLNGESLKFHDEITTEVCNKFKVRRTKLPGHITLKAPFHSENVDKLMDLLGSFARNNKKTPVYIDGYGSFRNDVVFMKTTFSEEAKKVYTDLENLLKTQSWLPWSRNESGERVFHTTIVSKRIKDKFEEIWNYVNKNQCNFNIYFDNISVYVWEENTWILYKKFLLRD